MGVLPIGNKHPLCLRWWRIWCECAHPWRSG
nr:MAG TPA: hypothetical protein [Caudoviricetes sp.]